MVTSDRFNQKSHFTVFRWLVTLGSITANVLGAVRAISAVCTGTQLTGNKLSRIGVNSNSTLQLSRLQIQPKQGWSVPHRKLVGFFLSKAIEGLWTSLTTIPRILIVGILASLERAVPMGRLHMRPFQWYPKTHFGNIPNHLTFRFAAQRFWRNIWFDGKTQRIC